MFRFCFITFTVFSFTFIDTGCFLDIKINGGFRCRYCWCSCSWCIDVFVMLNWVDSSCLFSDTTLEWMFDMATVYVAVVERLDSSGFSSLFFGIFNFLTLFWLLDVPFPAIALISSFAFKKKATKMWMNFTSWRKWYSKSSFYVGEVYVGQAISDFDQKYFLNTYFL